MSIYLGVLIILLAHFMADFPFQPHSIATKKSYSIGALIIHIFTYTTVFFILFCSYGIILNEFWTFTITLKHWIQIAIGISLVNGILHYLIDYVTSKITRFFWTTEQWRNFFLTIGFDQLLHTGLLIFSYAQMLSNLKYI